MGSDHQVNILIVDDEPGNLLATEAVLKALGQNLVTARSGEEALRLLLRQDFALILMDVRMPGMDGLEAAALVRGRDRTRHVPIIFLTGYDRSDVQLFRGYELGAVDFLTKPIVPEVLRSKAAVFVELARKAEEVRRQGELLREAQEREHERRLAGERQRLEAGHWRQQAERERRAAEELARAEGRARERARQQGLVAALGQRALANADPGVLLDEAAGLVRDTLGADAAAVFELLPDDWALLLRAGAGWDAGAVGQVRLPAGPGTAGGALLSEEPLALADLAADPRFGVGGPLQSHGFAAAAGVLVHGNPRPYGVLAAFARAPREFPRDDLHFLQAVANVLAAATVRSRHEAELAALRDELADQLADMTRLHRLSARLSNTLELPAVLQEVLNGVVELQGVERGVLVLADREGGGVRLAAAAGLGPDEAAAAAAGAGAAEWGHPGAGSAPTGGPGNGSAPLPAGCRGAWATPLRNRAGEAIGAAVTYFPRPHRPSERDVRLVELYARQAAAAVDNARLYREIRDSNRGKDEFLAMLAHELRNPLAPVLNALHVVRLAGGDRDTDARAREMVERQIRHMTRLIDDLLDVSRITRGKIQLRKEDVDLAAVVARAVDSARPLVEQSGHRLEVAVGPEPLWLHADPTRVEQVLANLLNNAAKYTEPGGRIWLAAGREGGEAVVRVRDTGIGIPPDLLPRVFELFMQAHSAMDRSQGGLGIGLTLVHRLVQLHGGSVGVHSEGPGRGSEFVVRLPLTSRPASEEAGSPPETAPPAPPARRARRVLVVDDNRDAAQSLSMMLELDGHEVRTAHDGPVALEAVRDYEPEVVLLDIGLPGMSGYEVARRLCAGSDAGRPVLVAMTGYGQEEDRRRTREAGFHHHLIKPVDPQVIRQLLARP
jgi:signal transduction histidine kinase/DNA-binding response OmpR family regulator